jgi:hypothetical protein
MRKSFGIGFAMAILRKVLWRKDLGFGGRAGFAVSPLVATTYA